MFQLSWYAPIRLDCFYNKRLLRVRWSKECCFHMYASRKAVAVSVCFCKDYLSHVFFYLGFSCQGMFLEVWYASKTDVSLRVRLFKACSLHMYAFIKADAVRICLFKDRSFHMYSSIKVSVVRFCFYFAGVLA